MHHRQHGSGGGHEFGGSSVTCKLTHYTLRVAAVAGGVGYVTGRRVAGGGYRSVSGDYDHHDGEIYAQSGTDSNNRYMYM